MSDIIYIYELVHWDDADDAGEGHVDFGVARERHDS